MEDHPDQDAVTKVREAKDRLDKEPLPILPLLLCVTFWVAITVTPWKFFERHAIQIVFGALHLFIIFVAFLTLYAIGSLVDHMTEKGRKRILMGRLGLGPPPKQDDW